MIGIHLNSNKKMSLNDLKIYNKPEYVYIPLVNGKNKEVIEFVKKGDYIYKGMIIAKTKGNLSIPIISSISGELVDFEQHLYLDGTKVKCAKIKNDFKEKIEKNIEIKEKINDYNKEQFIELLKSNGIVGLGGSGFPTYLKYQSDNIKTLIINAVECEPYITADNILIQNKIAEILESIDAIMEINKIEECFIAIKSENKKIKEIINNYIGTYLKIKLVEVPNLYPMGWEKSLVKYIKKVDYEKLPIEKNIVVENISTIYAIYSALKYNKPLIERIVTITGDMIKNPTNVLVKVGSNLSEVIESITGIKRNNDIVFIAGGPMMGTSLDSSELIVTPNLNNILVLKYSEQLKEETCLRCGKCSLNCPAKLEPVLIKDNINNIDTLKQLQINKCIECGICSYICPAKINVREYVREAKENLRGDK